MAVISLEQKKRFLADLFAGPFPGHGIIMDPNESVMDYSLGDAAISDKPLDFWAARIEQNYEIGLKWSEATGDDFVPYANLWTGTEIFASSFGSPVHWFTDSPACAMPLVSNAEEADNLPVPDIDEGILGRIFDLAELVSQRLGPDVPVSVPDIQSPFDIAALIWRKEDMFIAMHENPDAVKRLVAKCQSLLTDFLLEFKRRFPNCNLAHCPRTWAPPELGCWLSEDEAGSLSQSMFEEFCLPSLVDLSDKFGGLFMHCCATADHQYSEFLKIPNLRGINRVFQEPGFQPAIEAFSGHTVLMMSWYDEQIVNQMLDMSLPDTRFLFNIPTQSIDEAKAVCDRIRTRIGRG